MSLIEIEAVEKVVTRHYGQDIWRAVKVGLAVIASLSLKGRDNCVVLVYEGASGAGKSITIRLVSPKLPSTEKFLIRVDDFTAAAFVSHAANKSAEDLAHIDLLPKITNKAMLTKELAPLFQDDERILRQNFARLTSILDGNGYLTSSGTHGSRGYVGQYLFNWLGATTPVPDRTFKVMAQLGNRILFYEIASEEWSEDELMVFAQNYGTTDAINESQVAVNRFIEGFFVSYGINSVDPHIITIPEDITRELVRYAKLIASGRVEVRMTDASGLGSDELEASEPEGPQRVILLLQSILRGLTLIEGRSTATCAELEPIRHIAFSSIPRKRRELLRALLMAGGSLTTREAAAALGCSSPTAALRMKELGATSLVSFTPGDSKSSTPAEIKLASDWVWLAAETPPTQVTSGPGALSSLGTPLKRKTGCEDWSEEYRSRLTLRHTHRNCFEGAIRRS